MTERAAADATLGRPSGSVLTAVPVEKVPRDGLRRLLARQREEWLETLEWDFAPVAELIFDAVSHGVLRGVALQSGGEPIGFAVYTLEPRRCLIGEIYVAPAHRTPETGRALAEAMLGHAPRGHTRRRVETQSVIFDSRGVDEAFAEAGFMRMARYYMAAATAAARPDPGLRSSGRIAVRSWLDGDFGRASEVIYVAYKGTEDARVNSGYRSREGCADLLEALTESTWCGQFDPAITQVAVDAETGRPCGVAIASRISPSAAHLGQVSVLPSYQGRGVGRALVAGALDGAGLAGLESVTLAVTAANERALRLYRSCGFQLRLEFPVYFRG
jgi:ribosomal protein S18 acetylase RimI-like enzyme